jgi:DNA-binding MarR family transcriptional regulator
MKKIGTNRKAYDSGLVQGKAYRILTTNITDVLLPYSISMPEWKLLGQLAEGGNMKLAKLAELLAVEAPLVTALVDSLEKKGLVKRTSDPQDKRAKLIEATPKAMKILEELEPKVKAKARLLLDGISQDDLVTYLKVLDTIVKNG